MNKGLYELKVGKKVFPSDEGGKNGDFSDHSERRIFRFLRIFMIVKVVIFSPLCQREKRFSLLDIHKGLCLGCKAIHFEALNNV